MAVAKQFLDALFAPYSGLGDGFDRPSLEIRALAPRGSAEGTQPVRQWFGLDRTAQAAEACMGLAETMDVYVGVLPRRGHGGRMGSVPWGGWLFADIDGGDEGVAGAVQLVAREPRKWAAPHMMVVSGGGVHCYWRLREAAELADAEQRAAWKAAEKGLVAAIGGNSQGAHADPQATDIARILRVPGTVNHKRGRPVELIRLRDGDHGLDTWLMSVGMAGDSGRDARATEGSRATDGRQATEFGRRVRKGLPRAGEWRVGDPIPDGLLRWARTGYVEGERHGRIVSDAKWLVRDIGMPTHVAESLIRTKAMSSPGSHPIGDGELKAMMRWANA